MLLNLVVFKFVLGILKCLDGWWMSFLFFYSSLAASRTFLQHLLTCLNFTLDSEDFFCLYKQKKWFLWTMAMSVAWPDTYY